LNAQPNQTKNYNEINVSSDIEVDEDADGVCNGDAPSGGPSGCIGIDVCPGTPFGEDVDADGCSQLQFGMCAVLLVLHRIIHFSKFLGGRCKYN